METISCQLGLAMGAGDRRHAGDVAHGQSFEREGHIQARIGQLTRIEGARRQIGVHANGTDLPFGNVGGNPLARALRGAVGPIFERIGDAERSQFAVQSDSGAGIGELHASAHICRERASFDDGAPPGNRPSLPIIVGLQGKTGKRQGLGQPVR